MATRRRAREVVLQLLYQHDVNPEQDAGISKRFLAARLREDQQIMKFADSLLTNIMSQRKRIDEAISARATNWHIRRMPAVDRNILRLGVYEILMSDTPGQVAINEAIELAKRYGDRNSGSFINGVLDRVLRDSLEPTCEEAGEQEQLQVT